MLFLINVMFVFVIFVYITVLFHGIKTTNIHGIVNCICYCLIIAQLGIDLYVHKCIHLTC